MTGICVCIGIDVLLIVMMGCFHFYNKEWTHNFVIKLWGKKTILHYTAPFWLTIILTLVFNLSLNAVNIPAEYSDIKTYGIYAINLIFAIITFFLGLYLQRFFLQALFSKAFTKYMDTTSGQYFVLQAFTVELYRQFADTDNFLTHFKNVNFKNIDDLIKNIQAPDGGVSLPTYLYAVLLKESLLQKPTILFSVWNLNVVKLSEVKDYDFYTTRLDYIYGKLDKDNKRRIFVSNDKLDITDDIRKQHGEWGFESIYWCSNNIFDNIRESLSANDNKYDDFILFESGKNKWVIGKDKDDKKTRICYKDETVSNMKHLFSDENIKKYELITTIKN